MANPKVGLTKHRRPFPLGDLVILEELKEEKSAGGIFLPKHVQEQNKQRGQADPKISIGRVLATGEGPYTDAGVRIPMEVKVGDIVAYAESKVVNYQLDGETYLIAGTVAIIARISDAPYKTTE